MKSIITLCLLATTAISVVGATLSPDESLQRARLSTSQAAKAKLQSTTGMRLSRTFTAEGLPTLYAFCDGRSTLLLSADDCAAPVLGYVDGTADIDALPANMSKWVDEYSRQIAWARAHNIPAFTSFERPERDPISPLLASQWSQKDPYNRLCPIDYDGNRSVTGCVATAMAQVMRYYQWPAQAQGSVQYQWQRWDGSTVDLSLDLSSITFDWDNMLDQYQEDAFNDAQANAVAQLMQACGYAVEMSYSSQSSGTMSGAVPVAMVKNFDYATSTQLEIRDLYTLQQWEEIIYDNLKEAGPVLYSGITTYWEGHEFVCDGYDSDGFFHINWGWNGLCDGYFLLDALTPEVMGTGGSESGEGFIYLQDAVIGLVPSNTPNTVTADPYLYISAPLNAWIDEDDQRIFILANDINAAGNRNVAYDIAFRLTNEEGFNQVYTVETNFELPVGYYVYDVGMYFTMVPSGSYHLTPVYRLSGDTEWLDIRRPINSDPDILLDYDGEQLALHVGELTYGELQVPPLSVGATAEVSLTATSTYRVDQECPLALLLASGEDGSHTTWVQTLFEIINIPAGGSGTWKWQLEIPETLEPGEYSLWLYEPTGSPFYGADVTITEGAGVNSVASDNDASTPQFYNLSGRPVAPGTRGLLISRGKKVLK